MDDRDSIAIDKISSSEAFLNFSAFGPANQPVSSGCVGTKRTKELIACLQPDRRVEIFVDEKREVKITKPAKPKK